MTDKGCKKLSCLCMICACLAAAERMRECIESVNGAFHKILIVANHFLCDIIDTAYGRDDPDLIADRRAAVFSTEAHKGLRLNFFREVEGRSIGILHLSFQICLHVVGVHPCTGLCICCRVTDGKAVFDDILTVFDRF